MQQTVNKPHITNTQIRIELRIYRILIKAMIDIPEELETFLAYSYGFYMKKSFKKIKRCIKNMLNDNETKIYLNNLSSKLNLHNIENKNFVFSYICKTYLNDDTAKIKDLINSFSPDNELIGYLHGVYSYLDSLFPYVFYNNFSKKEIDIIKFLCTRGSIDEAVVKFNCLDFEDNFVKISNTENLTQALRKFMYFVYDRRNETLFLREHELRNECMKVFIQVSEFYSNPIKICSQNNYVRMIIESAIMGEYNKITLEHEKKPYLHLVKKFSDCFCDDFVNLLTGEKEETLKQRFKRCYETQNAVNFIQENLRLK